MKVFSILFSIGIICFFTQVGTSQGAIKEVLFDQSHIGESIEATQYNYQLFNYNEYIEINTGEFSQTLGIDDLTRFTLFIVFNSNKDGQFAKIVSDDHVLEFHNDKLVTSAVYNYELEHGTPHILMYRGGNGKKTKRKVTASEIMFADERDTGDFNKVISLAEVQVYPKVLPKDKIRSIQSALSIKYGIPLPKDSAYVNSANELIYATYGNEFSNQVRALGRDDNSNLYCKQSVSIFSDSFEMSLALGGVELTNSRNTTVLEDRSFLFWADNGAPLGFNREKQFGYLLDRVWKLTPVNLLMEKAPLEVRVRSNSLDMDRHDYFINIYSSANLNDLLYSYPIVPLGDGLGEAVMIIDDQHGSDPLFYTIEKKRKGSAAIFSASIKFENPSLANTKVHFQINGIRNQNCKMLISSLDGKQISSFDLPDSSVRPAHTFSTSGVFLVTLIDGEDRVTKKLIIQ